jgi:hypothetical protein
MSTKKSEPTNEKNLHSKLASIENMLDTIEDDLDNKDNLYHFPSNVVYIIPDIKTMWELVKNDDVMTLFELLDYCEVWVNELAIAVVQNKPNLKNKKITKHMRDLVEICRFVVYMTHNWLLKLNQE